jgi:AcrR family transcriptional regulator
MLPRSLLDTIVSEKMLTSKGALKQQKILEAAITLFAEKGYGNTSTSEIAKSAGVAEGTIFRYYGTKEKLLFSMITPFIKKLIPTAAKDLLEEVNPQSFETFEDFLRAFINNRMKFVIENKEMFQILVKEFLYREDFRQEVMNNIHTDFFNSFNNALSKFKESGEIACIPNETLMRIIPTFLIGYFTTRFIVLRQDVAINNEEEVNILIGFIMNGIVNHRREAKQT